MSFGERSTGFAEWTLSEDEAQPFFAQAVELGITSWDTANVYSYGSSEEIVGRAITKFARREDIVLATKVRGQMHPGPGGNGLSRKAILEQIRRVRCAGWVPTTSTSTRSTASTARRRSPRPWRRCMTWSRRARLATSAPRRCTRGSSRPCSTPPTSHGWTRFVSMQDQYSLLMREDEREMFGLLAHQGVGCIPWCPLAKGRLARPWGEQHRALRHRRHRQPLRHRER